MIATEEQLVWIAEIDRESHRLGKGRNDIHIDGSQVLARLALEILRPAFEDMQLMIHAAANVGKCSAEVGTDEFQLGMPVEQTAGDDTSHRNRVLEHVAKGAGQLVPFDLFGRHRFGRMKQNGNS